MITAFIKNRKDQLQRYALSGTLVFLLGHLQYRFLYAVLDGVPLQTGAAWGLHFIITTFWSHALHRGYTFRDLPQLPYWESLVKTFGSYSFILVLSTVMMVFLCDVRGLNPVIGWLLETGFCAACNFLIMSYWTICDSAKDIPNEIVGAHPDCPD